MFVEVSAELLEREVSQGETNNCLFTRQRPLFYYIRLIDTVV